MIWLSLVLLGALLSGLTAWSLSSSHGPPAAPTRMVTWRVVLPRGARFAIPQAAAWFAGLMPLLSPNGPRPVVDLLSRRGELALEVTAPASWEAAVRGQLAAWFPGARLDPAAPAHDARQVALVPLTLEKPAIYPLHTPRDREPDPLLGVLGALTHLPHVGGLRVTWGPAPADWKVWAPAALSAMRAGRKPPPRGWQFYLTAVLDLIRQATVPAKPLAHVRASAMPELKSAARKVREAVVEVAICVWAAHERGDEAFQGAENLAAQVEASFRHPFGNALTSHRAGRLVRGSDGLGNCSGPSVTLTNGELATLIHLPTPDHPLLAQAPARIVAPPARLLQRPAAEQEPITYLGEALTPAGAVPFGLTTAERRLHTYVVGKTGTGKSTLLAGIIRQDLEAGRGVGLIDPHGDLAERVLAFVPPKHDRDVCYFNPADADFPIGFNLLARTTRVERPLVASGVVSVFKRLYPEFWGPRLEHFLRNALLALLETPNPSLLLLPRLLTDRPFRHQVVDHVRDPVIRDFFEHEFERYDPRWRAEAVSPILNKVGAFLGSPLVRHIVAQDRAGLDLRQLIDGGGILIANLAAGKIGEDNAALLGGLLVVGLQLAAMGRVDLPEEERRDFHLTVDEFQHFTTDAFEAILSEARKYRLSLTLAHQHLSQLSPSVADAVLGNVGSLCVFRMGAPDTLRLGRELAPSFDSQDLVHLPNYHFCARLTQDGETLPAFSARTLRLPECQRDIAPVIEQSRRRWARPRPEVELEIADLWEGRSE